MTNDHEGVVPQMKTYRVTTVHKTVYVYNVMLVDRSDDDSTVVFHRVGGSTVEFPLSNLVSFEVLP